MAAACLAALPLRADELLDIDKLYRAGDVQQALRKADEAIAAQPRAAQVRFLKGVMLADLKRNAQAIEVFAALTQDFPELPDPYNNLAVLYAAEGQLQNALVALQTALRNDPAHRAARENLGDVYLALAIGCGSKVVPWMNDSGFWIIGRMSGMTEIETLRSASVMMSLMGCVGFGVVLLGAWLLPLK